MLELHYGKAILKVRGHLLVDYRLFFRLLLPTLVFMHKFIFVHVFG